MAKNRVSTGGRVHVTAAVARTTGTLVVESQLVGVPITDAIAGARYALDLDDVWDVPFVTGALKGDDAWITTDGTNVVSRTAHGAAPPVGTVYAGRIVAVPGDASSKAAGEDFPKTGRMHVRLPGAGR